MQVFTVPPGPKQGSQCCPVGQPVSRQSHSPMWEMEVPAEAALQELLWVVWSQPHTGSKRPGQISGCARQLPIPPQVVAGNEQYSLEAQSALELHPSRGPPPSRHSSVPQLQAVAPT